MLRELILAPWTKQRNNLLSSSYFFVDNYTVHSNTSFLPRNRYNMCSKMALSLS